MEKAEILRLHENYITNSYEEIRYYEEDIREIDKKVSLLIEDTSLDLSTFYSLYASLILDKTLDLIQIEEIKCELMVSRARVFFELGLIHSEERKDIVREEENSIIRYADVEYKLMLIKLASIKDIDSKEYEDLVNYVYNLKSKGSVLKQNVLKKDIF